MSQRSQGECAARFAAVREAFAKSFAAGARGRRFVRGDAGRRAASSTSGGTRRRRAHARLAARHDRERLLHHEGDGGARASTCWPIAASSTSTRPSRATGPSSRRAGRARCRCATCSRIAPGSRRCVTPLPTEALFDWQRMTDALAAEAPWWEPGSRAGYHAMTYGFLVGEVLRRVDGRTLGAFFRDEVAQPARRRLPDRPAGRRGRARRGDGAAVRPRRSPQPAPRRSPRPTRCSRR